MKRAKRILLTSGMFIVLAAMFLTGHTAMADSGFAGGTGTLEDPWLIETPEQLASVAEAVYSDSHFKLNMDIDMSAYLSEGGDGWNDGAGWEPIGTSGAPFTGSFDGDGQSIENLFIDRPGTDYIGLFGYIGSGADIRNVDLVAVDVTGAGSVGGLVGCNIGGAITACSAAGEVVGHFGNVGGLVGYNKNGAITECSAGGSVEGVDNIGGLVGYNDNGEVSDSYAAADVTGSRVGGLVGYNTDGSVITESWATGNVTGSREYNGYVGGLAGYNSGSTITESWATGNVEGSGRQNDAGGLVGLNMDSGIITNSYATGNVKNNGRLNNTGGLVGRNHGDNDAVISGSYASGGVLGTDDLSNVGGLVGFNEGVITESQAVGSVTCSGNESCAGGLVGKNTWRIEKSKASGSVVGIGSDIQVGGLVGFLGRTLYNSYATGSVTGHGTGETGGLIGVDSGTIGYSYSTGTVVGSGTIGGLVGRKHYDPPAFASFWDTQASRQSDSDGGTGKTTAEMKKYATFYGAGWDFIGETANGANSIWGIDESATSPDNNGYPFLAWEGYEHQVRPSVTTGAVTGIGTQMATGNGEITGLGYPAPTQHGVAWSKNENPTLDYNKTEEGEVSESGAFSSTITGLEPETTYYVRAYAINAAGTVYGEQVSFTTSEPDTTPPVVADGTIGITDLEETEVTLSWSKATDDVSDQSALQYLVYRSDTGNIDTVENIEANGTAEGTYEADIDTKETTGLTGGATYYFNVIVKDEAGNKTAYTMQEVTTDAAPSISPAHRNYDLSNPQDVSTTITWNSAASVTDVVYSVNPDTTLYTLDTGDYTVAGDDLTIANSFFTDIAVTTGDSLVFTINFDADATATLTVDVVDSYVPGNNADLSSLSVNGTPVSGFNPSDTGYDVELPYGSSSATVVAIADDINAGVDITQASSLPGTAIVTVTAEDGTTIKTYTINLTIGAAPTISVTSITVTGTGGVSGVQVGNTLQMLADVLPLNATDRSVTWSIEAGSGATIDASGLLTATAEGSVTVRATANDGSGVYGEKVIPITATPVTTYTVTASAGGGGVISPGGSVSVVLGGSQTFTITPYSGYRISSVTVDGVNQGAIASYTFTNVMGNHTINAAFSRTSSSGGSSGGGSTPSAPKTPEFKADVDAASGLDTTLPVTVDEKSGSAGVDVGGNLMTDGQAAVVTVPSVHNVDTYTLGVPVPNLTTPDEHGEITFKTDNGNVTVPSNMLTGVSGISGSKAQIAIGQGDREALPDEVKAAIGDRPLVQLTLSIDGKQTDWSNPSAPVTVSIPYTPTAAELANPESIVIWYIDGSGNVVTIPNGRYDAATGTVSFFTTHFSNYAVTYVHKTFSDLGSVEWARKAIEVMASKGITNGTGDGTTFSPSVNITRADFMVLLIKTLGLAAEFTENFDDVKPGAYYYNAIGVAKKLGIAAGSGNNLFKPTESISRQDMMVLAARALEKYQGLETAETNAVLERFTDRKEVAEYAAQSLATLIEAGLTEGSGGKLTPRAYTTRAEVAVFLYKIYNKYPKAPVMTASTMTRLAGQSRIDTALAAARAVYPDEISNAVIATA